MIKKYLASLFILVSVLIPTFFCHATASLPDANTTRDPVISLGQINENSVSIIVYNLQNQPKTAISIESKNIDQGINSKYFSGMQMITPADFTGNSATVTFATHLWPGVTYTLKASDYYTGQPIFASSEFTAPVSSGAVSLYEDGKTSTTVYLTANGLTSRSDVLFMLTNQGGTPAYDKTLKVPGDQNIGTVRVLFDGLTPGGSYNATVAVDSINNPLGTLQYTSPGVLPASSSISTPPGVVSSVATAAASGSKTAIPSVASDAGGLVPKCPDAGCGFPELLVLINKVISFLLFVIASPLAGIAICYAGYLYITGGSSEGNITKAKAILKNVVIGYVLALAAWVIVHSIVQSIGLDSSINTFLSK